MPSYFDETHRLLRESVRTFVARRLTPNVEEWEEAGEFPRALYREMGDAGFLGIGFPEELGGTPGDVFHGVVFTEEMCRCGSMGLVCGLGSHQIGLPPIVAMGTPEQQRRFIPPVLRGEKISALAITEPDAGSDVANIRTRAVRDGDHYVVNGAKTFITSGARADYVTAAVRTGGPGVPGISLLVIETDTPGFRVARRLSKMGWHASDTGELAFEDCRVPVANRLGEEGHGFVGIMRNFQGERLALAVMAHAFADLACEKALAYAREREAFGRKLTGFQVTRHKLVDMATAVEVAREFTYRIADRIRAGETVIKEIAMAKNFSCEAAERVTRDAIQVLGGYGYMREYAVERLYRDVRLLAIGGGTTEIMKEIIWKAME
jgi:acyl-CoA dehydrogenase